MSLNIYQHLQTPGIAPGRMHSDLTPGRAAVPRQSSRSGLAHGPGYPAYNGVFPISQPQSRAPAAYTQCPYSGCRYGRGGCSLLCLHGPIPPSLLLGMSCRRRRFGFTAALWTLPGTMGSSVLPEVSFSLHQLNKRQNPLLLCEGLKSD